MHFLPWKHFLQYFETCTFYIWLKLISCVYAPCCTTVWRCVCVCISYHTLSLSLCSLPRLQGCVGVGQVDYINVFTVVKGLENNLQCVCPWLSKLWLQAFNHDTIVTILQLLSYKQTWDLHEQPWDDKMKHSLFKRVRNIISALCLQLQLAVIRKVCHITCNLSVRISTRSCSGKRLLSIVLSTPWSWKSDFVCKD